MANLVTKVKREAIMACITCPLCNKLFRDATTISECLHTFCRKCIYDKISDEEIDCCPVCDIDLGCSPLEKLRPDHSLQDLRAKIFPIKRKKISATEVTPSPTLPARRKERSLSSLVVNTPKVSPLGTTTTGKRTKSLTRKAAALRGSSSTIDKSHKKDETSSSEENPDSSSSPETLNKFTQNIRQGSSAERRELIKPKFENRNDSSVGRTDLWKPLNCLVEVANRSKTFKSIPQGSDTKLESPHHPDFETRVRRTKNKDRKQKKFEEENHQNDPGSSEALEPKKLRRIRRKRVIASRDTGISPQAVLDASSSRQDRRNCPVWFSLVASEEQDGDAPLPQIPCSYLRIKDGSMPVSFIQKYLMKKLNLASETEVEIKCMGQTVVSSLQLHNLVELWLQATSTSERSSATIGSSAKDFVMVLSYARKEVVATH